MQLRFEGSWFTQASGRRGLEPMVVDFDAKDIFGMSAIIVPEVAFPLRDLWDDYRGHPEDILCIEIYDHWLEAAS